jgi:hypothetical protein
MTDSISQYCPNCEAQAKTIEVLQEQHEAYKQRVSDAIIADTNYQIFHNAIPQYRTNIVRFIIPKPTVDPLAVALAEWEGVPNHGRGYAHDAKVFRAALAKRGLKIVEIER